MLILAATVTLAGIAWASIAADRDDGDAVAPLDVSFGLAGQAGGSEVALRHLGGSPVPLADLRATVTSGGTTHALAAPLAGPPTWSLGDEARVTLATPLIAGTLVEVSLVPAPGAPARGIASSALEIANPVPPSTPGNTTMTLRFRTGVDYVLQNTSQTIYLEATVKALGGRKQVDRVVADFSALRGAPWTTLADDGTRGDTLAGDGTWTVVVGIPRDAPLGVHNVTVVAYSGGRVLHNGTIQVHVTHALYELPQFDPGLFTRVGWRLEKLGGNNIRLDLKLEGNLNSASIGGIPHRLDSVKISVTSHHKEETLSRECMVGNVARYHMSGKIVKYDPDADVLQYNIITTWTPTSGGGPTVTRSIEPSPPSSHFTLRPSETYRETGTPWVSYLDCTSTP